MRTVGWSIEMFGNSIEALSDARTSPIDISETPASAIISPASVVETGFCSNPSYTNMWVALCEVRSPSIPMRKMGSPIEICPFDIRPIAIWPIWLSYANCVTSIWKGASGSPVGAGI